jgi:hypothetical protein
MDTTQIAALLGQSGIRPVNDTLQKLDSVSTESFTAMRWDTGEAYGTAEQRIMENPAQFDSFVSTYLDKVKSRCEGDFAAIPAGTEGSGAQTVSAYEVACIGNNVDSSASVVFFAQSGLFMTIAHETATETMDIAMDLRDSIKEHVSGSTSALQRGF